MNGGTKMYTLKTIFSLTNETKQLDTMYKLKNIHEDCRRGDRSIHGGKVSDITEQVIKFLKDPLPEVVALEVRQEKILARLAELKIQVSSLCDVLDESIPKASSAALKKTEEEVICIDVVVNANPSTPPYSLLALPTIWTDTSVKITKYIHSSVLRAIPEFIPVNPDQIRRSTINVTLIWKEVTDLEFIPSSTPGYPPLVGEANLLRYLSRTSRDRNYETSARLSESIREDGILDLCHYLYYQDSTKGRREALSTIADELGIDGWFLDRTVPGIADVTVWSAIKQVPRSELPQKLASWLEKSAKSFPKK